ncbi:hypothetical protein K505DRAFT_380576 [Melanomma pulvis-pyrius CBS 109.77]|uniref:Uncharacterized protein n=1 Tax=Melanomma pulvis-pyrius CBS 109.77 TaxID=1314802 RepID=A0A6A6WPY1_9PLEO|nr:hypothetical protein K505DRAFT_380576 [Melanomma pulvis-pyrius CBS 109.77]
MGSIDNNTDSQEIVFLDDGGRVTVQKYSNPPKFYPNDRVYIITLSREGTPSREGPFIVSSVNNGKYILCDANKTPVKNGKNFEEVELELEPEDFF